MPRRRSSLHRHARRWRDRGGGIEAARPGCVVRKGSGPRRDDVLRQSGLGSRPGRLLGSVNSKRPMAFKRRPRVSSAQFSQTLPRTHHISQYHFVARVSTSIVTSTLPLSLAPGHVSITTLPSMIHHTVDPASPSTSLALSVCLLEVVHPGPNEANRLEGWLCGRPMPTTGSRTSRLSQATNITNIFFSFSFFLFHFSFPPSTHS